MAFLVVRVEPAAVMCDNEYVSKQYLVALYRITFGILAGVAVAIQLQYSFTHIAHYNVIHFFSFFTIQSNLFAVVMFAVAALWKKPGRVFMYIRGAAVLYMTITGIVYNVLLANADVQTAIPWVNATLHLIFPIVVLADWLIDRPKQALSFKKALWWLIYPIVYLCYSLIRGAYTGWYPYPFLNVDQHGAANVAGMSCVIALGTVILTACIVALSTIRRPRVR